MNKHSGYTEIQLHDSTVVPLKFGMWTMRELCRAWNVDLKGIQAEADKRMKADPFTAIFDMIGPAAEYGAAETGKPIARPTEMQISRWFDNTGGFAGSPILEQVMNAFANAMGGDLISVDQTPVQEPGKSLTPVQG